MSLDQSVGDVSSCCLTGPDDLHHLQERSMKNTEKYLKSFIAKQVISILVNMRYLRFKLLEYKENNKKICNTFDHNFKKYSFIYNETGIIRKVLFCIILWCPYFKNFKNGA